MSSISSDSLWAFVKISRVTCSDQNLSFLKCKNESEDPSSCLSQGSAVTNCYDRKYAELIASPCAPAFSAYEKCVTDKRGIYRECRDLQDKLMECAKENKVL
ncbi:hypothetical protein TrLO_g15081 [Triparma laevis f. longispina]|uniref:IMS import disulfide relay-system CHCH-CHCH-like Cx9C domain-containing protein n=1 Tax=Triparma laevis f. longispina TaxID=1714387 RepID=A0A9W7AE78_9STRA|nr:hypothetical protein TrLO_g15081 [Triparma laevis f. longispina]